MTDEDKLKSCVFFVEATSTEKFYLWKEYHEEIEWEEDNSGFSIVVGNISKSKPVNVCFTFAKIYGKRICFYEAVSRFVDHTMVENWIKKNYPDIQITDAMNFHFAINACKERKIKE